MSDRQELSPSTWIDNEYISNNSLWVSLSAFIVAHSLLCGGFYIYINLLLFFFYLQNTGCTVYSTCLEWKIWKKNMKHAMEYYIDINSDILMILNILIYIDIISANKSLKWDMVTNVIQSHACVQIGNEFMQFNFT